MGRRKVNKDQIRKAIHALYAQTEDELIKIDGRLVLKPRLSAREVGELCGLSESLIKRLVDMSSSHWEWLREEGIKPNAWKLRMTVHGTPIHFKKCALNEFKWRKSKKAIDRKEYNRKRLELQHDLRDMNRNTRQSLARKRKLKLIYVKLKGWNMERVQQAKLLKNQNKKKGKTNG
ncbi:hypothetical protein [Vibrio parahaemolyticus]|uniref:hypothetical protein n=2 Tax=Vibrio parahaemolyticus TaxID=670 RepID=UPI001D7BCF29|nr:hypothetical protein [Vibrio parahaemolyticus]UYW14404.1 hypothetical protein IF561_08980 [Vibrio parahaemolyticus]